MARRKANGSYAHSRIGAVQVKGNKAIIVMGEKHTRVVELGPDGSALPETELVNSEDVRDIRHVHNITTGQRRVVVLPADLCRRLAISEGTPLQIVEHESHFEVVPMRLVRATDVASPSLDSLLAGVTPENLHGEFDTGPAAGQEAW